MPGLTDIGANLAHDSFDADRDAVLQRAAAAGVSHIVVTGSSLDSSRQAAALSGDHHGVALYATAGQHPHHASDWNPSMAQCMRELSQHPRVVALGECGLDYHRNFSPPDAQRASFSAQIEIAIATQMPLFLHQRDAHADFLKILKPRLAELPGVVVHCFTGSAQELADYIALDVYIGITGWICDERRGAHLLDCVPDIPDNRLLIETDAPYLLPRSLKPAPKTRRNEPQWLPEVVRTVAHCRQQAPEQIGALTHQNAQRLFRLPAMSAQPGR